MDMDGAFIATADERAQAYSRDGQALFLTGGPHTTWLGQQGHARLESAPQTFPEGIDYAGTRVQNKVPLALYVGPGRDSGCAHATCGTPSSVPGSTSTAQNLDTQGLMALGPAPTLSWNVAESGVDLSAGTLETFRGGALHLALDVSGSLVPTENMELMVFAQPHAGDAAGQCTGSALGTPVVIKHTRSLPAGTSTVGLGMDLTGLDQDLPVHPSGCYRIRAFARQMAIVGPSTLGLPTGTFDPVSVPTTAWGVEGGDVRLLPPPPIYAKGPGADPHSVPFLVNGGEQGTVRLVIPEPLGLADDPTATLQLDLHFLKYPGLPTEGSPGPLDAAQDASSSISVPPSQDWDVVTTPGLLGVEIPVTMKPPEGDGWYSLQAQVGWSGAPLSMPFEVAAINVDTSPPSLTASVDGDWRQHWKGSDAVLLHGTVEDFGADVDSLDLRLVRDRPGCRSDPGMDGCLVDLYIPYLSVDQKCYDERGDHFKCVREVIRSYPTGQQPQRTCIPGKCFPVPATRPTDLLGNELAPVATQQQAVLKPNGTIDGMWSWSIGMHTRGTFIGGPVFVQYRAVDQGGKDSLWQDLIDPSTDAAMEVIIDKSPPAPAGEGIRSSVGTIATNATYQPDPLVFEAVLEDCSALRSRAQGACLQGSGVDGGSVVALIRNRESNELIPFAPSGSTSIDPSTGDFVAAFEWSGQDSGPEPGAYEVVVQAQDKAGNLLSYNPGLEFYVDRAPPVIPSDAGSRQFNLPDGQKWIKPGDLVNVSVIAFDAEEGRTWIEDVTVELDGEVVPMVPGNVPHQYWKDVEVRRHIVPEGSMDPLGGTPVKIKVTARDAASNSQVIESSLLTFYRDPSPLLAPSSCTEDTCSALATIRSDSMAYEWRTDRKVQIQEAFIVPSWGDQNKDRIQGTVVSDGTDHLVTFGDLDDDSLYRVFIEFRDDAGHLRDLGAVVGDEPPIHPDYPDIRTLVRQDTDLFINGGPVITYSGSYSFSGRIERPVPATVEFRVGAPDGDLLDSFTILPADVDSNDPGRPDHPFHFSFDSTTIVATLTKAQVVPLYVIMDDGATIWQQSVAVRFDNAPPVANPKVDGLTAVNGWYNSTILVLANATDDTLPITHFVRLNGGTMKATDRVQITAEGRHTVEFFVSDAAHPSNPQNDAGLLAIDPVTYKIDRTAPTLDVSALVQDGVTSSRTVGLEVQADDVPATPVEFSGVDAYRHRVDDGPWSGWQLSPPHQVILTEGADGERWIDVEVRDLAGNIRRESASVILDRTDPQLVQAKWIGRSEDGDPVLHVVADDPSPAGQRSSGVVALRYGPIANDSSVSWNDWVDSGGIHAFTIPQEVAPEGGRIMLGIRDAAGNEGLSAPIDVELPNYTLSAGPPLPTGPTADLMREVTMSPAQGNIQSRFVFSAVFAPWNDSLPDRTWVEVADQEFNLTASGPVLESGARLYLVAVRLPPTPLDEEYTHRFHALYGTYPVSGAVLDGPTVLAVSLGTDTVDADDAGQEKRTSAPSFFILLMVLGAWAFAIKQRNRNRGGLP